MKTIAILGLSLILTACDDQQVIEQLDYIDDVVAEELDLIDDKIDYQAVAERWANSYSYLYIDWENTVYVGPWD
jgi:hypothetical protein